MECRTIEEFVRGPDGDEDRGLAGTLARIQADARREGIARVQVEIRVTPPGSPSRQEGVTSFQATDPPLSLVDALQRRLEESPGDGFAGELRLNFRALGDARAHLGSYTRRMRPAALAVDDDDGGRDTGPDVAALVVGYVRPFADLALRAFENSVQLQGAAANLVVATSRIIHPPAQAPNATGGSPVVHDLLRGALNLASVAGGKVGQAAQAGQALLPAPAPPPGPVVIPPGPDEGAPFVASPGDTTPAGLTSDDVAAWARTNPAEAEALVFRLIQERQG